MKTVDIVESTVYSVESTLLQIQIKSTKSVWLTITDTMAQTLAHTHTTATQMPVVCKNLNHVKCQTIHDFRQR